MKNFRIIKMGTAIAISSVFLGAFQALACSFSIDNLKQSNQIIAASASHLQLSLADVESVEIFDFDWRVSISTPMCPKEITYEATVVFQYKDPETNLNCESSSSVVKKNDWEDKTEKFDFIIESNCVANQAN